MRENNIGNTKFHIGDRVVPIRKEWWPIGVIQAIYKMPADWGIRYSINTGVVGYAGASADEIRLATDDEWDEFKFKRFTPKMVSEIEGESNE